jgi:uncharacterized protein (UPF0332 family)
MLSDENKLSAESKRWIDERFVSGNWWDVKPDDEIPADVSGWSRTIFHMFQISFAPEIRRRHEGGSIGEDFFLSAAQLIQPEEGSSFVRLNNEVLGLAYLKMDRAVQKGDSVTFGDLRHLESFDVVEEELNCGHFTIFWHGQGWIGSFDFRSSRDRALQTLGLAKEFLLSAQFGAENGFSGSSVDNLFSACELIAKAHLMLHRDRSVKSKKHAAISSAINNWGRLGNIGSDFLNVLNRVSNERSVARYDPSRNLKAPEPDDFMVAQKELDNLVRRVARRDRKQLQQERTMSIE